MKVWAQRKIPVDLYFIVRLSLDTLSYIAGEGRYRRRLSLALIPPAAGSVHMNLDVQVPGAVGQLA